MESASDKFEKEVQDNVAALGADAGLKRQSNEWISAFPWSNHCCTSGFLVVIGNGARPMPGMIHGRCRGPLSKASPCAECPILVLALGDNPSGDGDCARSGESAAKTTADHPSHSPALLELIKRRYWSAVRAGSTSEAVVPETIRKNPPTAPLSPAPL